MTERVAEISRSKAPGKKNATDTPLKHEKSPRHTDEAEHDSIDISEEARDRAAGRKRGNILDYLKQVSS